MSEIFSRAIALVTDGQPVDWEGLIEDASPADRLLLEELRGIVQLDREDTRADERRVDATIGAPSPQPAAQRRRWGHLELLDEIGRGAYGVVYRAWDTRLAREVALKVFNDDEAGKSIEEARRLARVSHPHVVSVHGADRIDGRVGLWMELLKGRTLDEILDADGAFSAREATGIAVEICGAVAAIHAAGLVHRDIKAQNVVREPGGRLVLMDMGASVHLSRDAEPVASLAGTPLYMAPELFDGRSPSVESDVYAIGVLLYRLVTAAFPLDARTIGALRQAHADARLRPLRDVRPELPAAYVEIVERCLSSDPRKRFPGVAPLERALLGLNEPASAVRLHRRSALNRLAAWGALAATAVVGPALTWAYATRPSRPDAITTENAAAVTSGISKLFAAYEELAFNNRVGDPKAAIGATHSAFEQMRTVLPGNHAVYALLNARLSELSRRAGLLQEAESHRLDGASQALEVFGEDHPYAALLAMEHARNAQAAHDHHTAAVEIARALDIRWRLLGLSEIASRRGRRVDVARLERLSPVSSASEDRDGDGLLDLLEGAVGLDSASSDSDRDGTLDDDEDLDGDGVSERLALGLTAPAFSTWAHYGSYEPRFAAWQSPLRFPMIEEPRVESGLPGLSIRSAHSMGYFTQRLSPAHSAYAATRGFSLLARVQPIAGLTSLLVDLGPTFDKYELAVRRLDDASIEVRALTSVVPRSGAAVTIAAPAGGRLPLVELRYRPEWKSAAVYVDGRRVLSGYTGHRQFQEATEGNVLWGVVASGDGDPRAAAVINLFWLEVF